MKFKATGLTLVEALVTLAVAGVLLLVGLPSLTVFLENSQLNSDTNDLFMSLMLTRSEAVTRNTQVAMCKIDPADTTTCDNTESWQSGWINFVDTDGDGTRDADEVIIGTYLGMNDNSVVTAAGFANSITYLPSGSSNTNGSFNVCVSGNLAQDVFINATGRPRIADGVCP